MKLHLPLSLLAALTVCALPVSAAKTDPSAENNWTLTYSGSQNNMLMAQDLDDATKVVFNTDNSNTNKYFIGASTSYTFGVDVEIQNLRINNGSSGRTYTFNGAWTGNGNFTYVSTTVTNQSYIFTGDMSGFKGAIDIYDTTQAANKAHSITFTNNAQDGAGKTLNASSVIVDHGGFGGSMTFNGTSIGGYTVNSVLAAKNLTLNTNVAFNKDVSVSSSFTIASGKSVSFGDSEATLDVSSVTITNNGTLDMGSKAILKLKDEPLEGGDSFTIAGLIKAEERTWKSVLGLTGERESATYENNVLSVINQGALALTWNGTEENSDWYGTGAWLGDDDQQVHSFQTNDSITFGADGYKRVTLGRNVIANNVTINADYTLDVAEGTSSVEILGTLNMEGGSLTKDGSGTLALSLGQAESLGPVTVSAGGLSVSTAAETASSLASLSSVAAASFTKSGGGALTIDSLSGYSGSINLHEGTLTLGGSANLASVAYASGTTFAVTGEGTHLQVGSSTNNTHVMSALTDKGSVCIDVKQGAKLTEHQGYWVMSKGASLTVTGGGVYAVNGIALSYNDGNNTHSNDFIGHLTVDTGTTLHITGTTTSGSTNNLQNLGSFLLGNWNRENVVDVYGTLISNAGISNANNTGSSINVKNGGVLAMKSGIYFVAREANAASSIDVESGGTLAVAQKTATNGTESRLTVTLADNSTVKAWVQNDTAGHEYLGDGEGSVTISHTFDFAEGAVVNFSSAAGQNLVIESGVSGAAGIKVIGTGEVSFTNLGTYTGTVEATTGATLNVNGETVFTQASVSGGTLNVNANTAITGSLSVADGGLLALHSGVFDVSALFDGEGSTTLSNNGSIVFGPDGQLKLVDDLSSGGTFTVGTLSYSGETEGDGYDWLWKHIVGISARAQNSYDGATLSIGAAQTYRLTWNGGDGTWVSDPEGSAGPWSAEGSSITTFADGDAVIFGTNESTDTITISGQVVVDNKDDVAGIQVLGKYIFNGQDADSGIVGAANMTIGSEGDVTLNSNNHAWDAEVRLEGGTLRVNAEHAMGHSAVKFDDTLGGTLELNVANAMNDSEKHQVRLELNGESTLVLGASGALGEHTTVAIDNGIIRYGSGVSDNISGKVTVTNGLTIDANGNGVTWNTSGLSDKALVIQSSAPGGSVTLDGGTGTSNAYAGLSSVRVESGTLKLTNEHSLKMSGNTITSSVTLTGGDLDLSYSGSGKIYDGNGTGQSFLFGTTLNVNPDEGKSLTIGGTTAWGVATEQDALVYGSSTGDNLGGTLTINSTFASTGTNGSDQTRNFIIHDSTNADIEVDMVGKTTNGNAVAFAANGEANRLLLVKKGIGTLQISGSANFKSLTIEGGRLIANHADALGNGKTITMNDNTTLELKASNEVAKIAGGASSLITGDSGATLTVGTGTGAAGTSTVGSIEGQVGVAVSTGSTLQLTGGKDVQLGGETTRAMLTTSGTTTVSGTGKVEIMGDNDAAIASLTVAEGATQITLQGTDVYADRMLARADAEISQLSNAAITIRGEYMISGLSLVDATVVTIAGESVVLQEVTVEASASVLTDPATGSLTATLTGDNIFKFSEADQLPALFSAEMESNVLRLSLERLSGVSLANDATLTFIAPEGLDLSTYDRVEFVSESSTLATGTYYMEGYNSAVGVDGTLVFTAVPEPTSATLSLLALVALAARRRRK